MDEFDNSQKKAKDEFVLLLEEKTKEIDFLKSSVRLMEVEKIKLQRELTERTKELQSVYKLCSLLAPRYSTLNKTLQEFTNNIPSVWQFSKITGVKIIVGNNEFKTPKFKTSEWAQSENILVGGETIGRIEIYCPEQIHGEYYGPFFKKGQNLLCVIAEILGGIIGLKSLNSKLEEEEGLNRALVDTMPFAMRIINQSGIIIYSNEKLEKQLGANIEGKSCWCTYCSDKKQCSDCPLENGISIGKTIVFESEEIVENKVFEISTTGAVYDGEKVLIEIFRDITEQKKTVTSLNNINERLQGILNDLGDALVSVDKNGICTQVNLQISKMFGYEVNEIVGYPVAKLYADPADRDGLFEELAKKKEITDWVCQGIRKDNSTIWVSMNVRYLRNKENEIEGTIALIRDVSERKMAHMELEEKKIQFDSALEIAGLGYYIVTGATAQIDYIDKRARNIFGMAKNQKSNTIPFWLRNIHPEDVKYVKTIHNSVYEGKSETAALVYRYQHPKKGLLWLKHNAEVLHRDSDGKVGKLFGVIQNITELKAKEKELIEAKERAEANETRFRAITEQALDGITLADVNGQFVFANQAFLNMVGYSERELLFMHVSDLVPAQKKNNTVFHKIKQKGQYSNRSTIICKDNKAIFVDINGTTIEISGEMFVLGIVRDVSSIVQKEEELVLAKEKAEESEYRYRKAQEVGHIGSWEYDLVNNTIWGSDEGKRIYNLSQGKKYFSVGEVMSCVIEEDRERVSRAFVDLVAENKPYDIVFTIIPMHLNERKFIRSKANILRDHSGNAFKVTGVVQDITIQKHYESELINAKDRAEESDFRLKLAVDSGKLGVWDWQADGKQVVWNEKMFEFYGIDEKILAEDSDAWINRIHPEDREKVLLAHKTALRENGKFSTTFRVIRPDKTVLQLKSDGVVMWDKDNVPFRVLGLARDITDLVTRENELIKARNRAQESDRLKSAFLMNVSHEIRTPMNGILGFINLLNEPDLSEKDKQLFMDMVNKSGERLLNTINDIVEISKIEIGDLKTVEEEVNLEELMQGQFNNFAGQAKEKGIELQITKQLIGNIALVKTDKQKLNGILMNLIKNAIKFTTQGKIELGNYVENERLCFFVSDSGRGIPEDKLETIFDRFVQVELGNTRGYEGSGIGLSIVKAYVTALKGEIEVKSELRKGSTFLFSIPFFPLILPNKKENNKKEILPLKKQHVILIVEDDVVNFHLLQNILKENYKILYASNGKEAIKLFKNHSEISLILMDIKMHGELDGLDATKKIREINKAIPIIAQTAYVTGMESLNVLEAGFTDFISKPYNKSQLNTLIQKYIPQKGIKESLFRDIGPIENLRRN